MQTSSDYTTPHALVTQLKHKAAANNRTRQQCLQPSFVNSASSSLTTPPEHFGRYSSTGVPSRQRLGNSPTTPDIPWLAPSSSPLSNEYLTNVNGVLTFDSTQSRNPRLEQQHQLVDNTAVSTLRSPSTSIPAPMSPFSGSSDIGSSSHQRNGSSGSSARPSAEFLNFVESLPKFPLQLDILSANKIGDQKLGSVTCHPRQQIFAQELSPANLINGYGHDSVSTLQRINSTSPNNVTQLTKNASYRPILTDTNSAADDHNRILTYSNHGTLTTSSDTLPAYHICDSRLSSSPASAAATHTGPQQQDDKYINTQTLSSPQAAMSSFSPSYHAGMYGRSGPATGPSSNGRMTVTPVGSDSFMLSVEDTGINPHRLKEQIRDNQPKNQLFWETDPSIAWTPEAGSSYFYAPNDQRRSRQQEMVKNMMPTVGVNSVDGLANLSGQPFMVTWSENSLPRINMMSTPWLSNTIRRQGDVTPSPTTASPTPSHWASADDGVHHVPVQVVTKRETGTPPNREPSTDTPVYKLVSHNDLRNDHHSPQSGHGKLDTNSYRNNPSKPSAGTGMYNDYGESFGSPWKPPDKSNSFATLPSRPKPNSMHSLDTSSYRGHNGQIGQQVRPYYNTTQAPIRINAPKPIDVTQVPPAGRRVPMTQVNSEQDNYNTASDSDGNDVARFPVYYDEHDDESATPPPSWRRSANSSHSHRPDEDSSSSKLTVQRMDSDAEIPTFKISSSAKSTAMPRFSEAAPRPNKQLDVSDDVVSSARSKSPSRGYLQTYLREASRSPSPARRSTSLKNGRESERGRSSEPRSSRGSRERSRSLERRMRSPSPMPKNSRAILFNDEIDWAKSDYKSNKVDWDQIQSVLRCGQDVQRLSVVTSLPHLLRDNRDECLRRVIPKVKEFLPIAQPDMQMAASAILLQIFQTDLLPVVVFSQSFLPIILTGIDHKDSEISEAWLETLLDIIPSLSKEVLRKEVLSKAIQKGQISQNIHSRLISCRILGKISICLESFVIKKDILPLVQSLCQDVEYEVRACMCRQLDLVAKGLGLESTRSAIIPELVELANDEESCVRLAGLDTVVSVISLLDDETKVHTIIPLVKKFCQGALLGEDTTLPIVSRHLGKLCHGLAANMSPSQKAWFIDFYKQLCTMGLNDGSATSRSDVNDNFSSKPMDARLSEDERLIECRINAAFNFPAMTVFVGGSAGFSSDLGSSFSRLCKDCNDQVRKTMAYGFHEVARCVGSHISHLLYDLIILFKDDSIDVLRGVIQNFHHTVDMLSRIINPEKTTSQSNELLAAILSSEQLIFKSNDWRLQETFLEMIGHLTHLFSSDHIYAKLVPLVFNKLHTAKALPVRLAATKTLLVYLRANKRLEHRNDMCHRIVSEFGKGKSFRDRSIFIDICMQVLQKFSRSFFKAHFYENVLDLSSDLVPNIRLRLCNILPQLKLILKLPADRHLLQLLESLLRKLLINEKDRDVTNKLQLTVEEIDRIVLIHESRHSRQNLTDEDLADQKKEEEERQLIEAEEREKREDESDQSQSSGTKKKAKPSIAQAARPAASKPSVERKSVPSKASKIPTAPGATGSGKEPRRHSHHTMKPAPIAPNGHAVSGLATPSSSKGANSASGRPSKISAGSRNASSASSTNSGSKIGSAGSNVSRTIAGGSITSPVSSAGTTRRKPLEYSYENLRPDHSILGRKTSKEYVSRKPSH